MKEKAVCQEVVGGEAGVWRASTARMRNLKILPSLLICFNKCVISHPGLYLLTLWKVFLPFC